MGLEHAIKVILIENLYVEGNVDSIDSTSSIRDDLGLDSLGFEELRSICDERFGVEIKEEEFENDPFATVESLAGAIRQLKSAAGNAEQVAQP